ncbi:3-deoxy-7-phosphoheptulonate synthase [Streptomyces sp. NPDC006289]|uniref:3-deoxy-7-phosphoheptulonate synthase n=1 Tax=Streptomyces sp. NPDC006289 TaxID=3156744 RepID=UPI0033BE14D3
MTESGARRVPASASPGATARLGAVPPLVFAGECDLLTERLAGVARGEALVLWGADRTRSFDGVTADAVRARLRTLLQMSAILTYAASVPVVKLGQIGPDEQDTGQGAEPDPSALTRRYEFSVATLNLVRALATGGYADLRQVHRWNTEFVAASSAGHRYSALADEIGRALAFMRACGPDPAQLATVEFFAAHEARSPAYDSALTRVDSRTGRRYNTSGHFVWTGGAPTRYVDHLADVRNPVGVRLGAEDGPDDVLELLGRLDPLREAGRTAFLVRMDSAALRDTLPALVEKVTAEDHRVAWICAPAPAGGERGDTRRFGDVLAEVAAFFEVHHALGTHPGGLATDLGPDSSAALDLAFLVAELCRAPGTASC